MKMRKKLAALLAAAMIASIMPMSAFAASKNTINKVINVKEGEDLTSDAGVKLVIELQTGHTLDAGESFDLTLTDAEWDEDIFEAEYLGGRYFNVDGEVVRKGSRAVGGHAYTLTRQSATTLVVTAVQKIIGVAGETFSIPVVANVTGGTPKLAVNSYGTAVSSTEIVFVNATTGKAMVTLGKVPTIAKTAAVAEIALDEPFVGAFKQVNGKDRTFNIELRDNTFEIDNPDDVVLTGVKGLSRYSTNATTASIADYKSGKSKVLKFEVPDTVASTIRGGFIVEDLEVRPLRDARAGDIQAILSGDLVDRQVVTLAKYGDYTTTLKVARGDYAVVAGKEIDVKFTLTEDMTNAIIAGRKATFEFSKGAIVHELAITEKNAGAVDWAYIYDKEGKRTSAFEVTDFKPKANRTVGASYEFEATLYVEAGFTGDISLIAEGKAFSDELEVVVAKTEAPVTVEGNGATIKVGLQKQKTDATVTIKETAKHRLDQKKITLSLGKDYDDRAIIINGADVQVTEGDLEIEKTKANKDGTLDIYLKRFSSEPSTIVVKDMVFTADRTIPEGAYNLDVAGPAISELVTLQKDGEDQEISSKVATLKDFIVIGTPNTEDITDSANKAKVQFVIGASQYLVDGVEQTMDAAAYAKDGRTMVPVRYVAEALGITGDKVVWDGPNQAVTIIADKTIQVKLGSKMMLIDGVSVPMSAAAEAVSGRVFVPVAEIARGLGVSVTWDSATQTATFN